LLAAAATAFIGLGTFVAFHGWPSGDSAEQAGDSVYVGNGAAPADVPSRAAARALEGAPAGVAASALPSPALIAAAGGEALPSPGGGNGSRGGGRGGRDNDGAGGVNPPPPPPGSPLQQIQDAVNNTPNPGGGGTIGQTGLLDPVWSLVGVGAGLAGGTVDVLLGGQQSNSSQSGQLLPNLLSGR
jgi:hypothetical protein